MNEQRLLMLLKTDAEQGMRQILHVFGPSVHKICASLLAGRQCEEIEEAESDVFVKLWQHRENVQLSETYSLKSYLFAIARNVCKDRLRSASPETLSLELAAESGLEPESSERTEDNVAEHWLHETILSAIGELEDPARSVFYERYYEGRSVRDIALHLQLSEKKTENILHRGKSKLRSILAEKGVTSYEEFEK